MAGITRASEAVDGAAIGPENLEMPSDFGKDRSALKMLELLNIKCFV